jgi:hypothetical protein
MVFESLMSLQKEELLIKEERVKKEDFSREFERLLLFEGVSWQQKSRLFG